MAINPLFLSPHQADRNKTILELLPLEAALLIFEKLRLIDMVNCSEASKGLNALASDDRIWKPTAQLLGIRVEALSYPSVPAVTSGYKAAVGARILELKAFIAAGDPVLEAKVKTALEFDVEMIKGADEETLREELDQKHLQQACLYRGMQSHLFLRRVELSTLQKVQQYATVLEKKYGQNKTWDLIAKEHVREGHFKKAIEIMDAHLNTRYESTERNNLFYCMVDQFCEAGDFKNAIVYLKKLRSYPSWAPEERQCANIILAHAKEKRNFAVVLQMLMEDLIPYDERTSNIIQLIDVNIEERKYQQARDLVQQFADEIEENSGEYQIYVLIRIYVQLGQNQKAWDLAQTHQQYDVVFAFLRNAFTEQGLLAEAKKAQALIKK